MYITTTAILSVHGTRGRQPEECALHTIGRVRSRTAQVVVDHAKGRGEFRR